MCIGTHAFTPHLTTLFSGKGLSSPTVILHLLVKTTRCNLDSCLSPPTGLQGRERHAIVEIFSSCSVAPDHLNGSVPSKKKAFSKFYEYCHVPKELQWTVIMGVLTRMELEQLSKSSSTTSQVCGVKQTQQRKAMLQFLLESKQQPAVKDKVVKALSRAGQGQWQTGSFRGTSDTILTT